MLGVAVIGCGRIGMVHSRNAAAHAELDLRYVADAVETSARSAASAFGGQVASVDAIMADPMVKGVIICSPTPTHADLIEQAAQAGKAIFCEKPIDLDAARARACVAEVERRQVKLLLGFNRRFDRDFGLLRKRLKEGEIGAVEMIHITSRDPSPPPPAYVGSSGGLFRDMMIHDLDMARWLLGEEVETVCTAASAIIDPAIGAQGDVDSAIVTLRTASGKLCVISNSRRAVYGYDQRIEVHGSDGLLQADNSRVSNVRIARQAGESSDRLEDFFVERYAFAYRSEMAHFADVIHGRAEPMVSGIDGVRALELADAAQSSLDHARVEKIA